MSLLEIFYRFVTAVYPSLDDDVITSPYNSVLAMRQLTENADCVLPVENQVRRIRYVIAKWVILNIFECCTIHCVINTKESLLI